MANQKKIQFQDKSTLNKRSEIISHCRHQNNFKLKTLVSNTANTDITQQETNTLHAKRNISNYQAEECKQMFT